MKRTICMLTIAAGLGFTSAAQEVEVLPSPEITPTVLPRWGVRLQADVTWPSNGFDTYSSATGISGGISYYLPVYKGMYVEPAVLLYYSALNMNDYFEDNFPYSASVRNIGLRIPINIGYRFNLTESISLSLFTGPWFNFNLTAKQNATPKFEGAPAKTGKNLFDYGWHRFDAQWGFGISATFSGRYVIGLSGGVGSSALMTRDHNGKLHRMRRNTFSVTLGYNF